MEIITIEKEILNSEFDVNIYLYRNIKWNKSLKFLFEYSGYFCYCSKDHIISDENLITIKNYVIESLKENNQNTLNI